MNRCFARIAAIKSVVMTLFFRSSRRGFTNVPCLFLFSGGPCTMDLAFLIDTSSSIDATNRHSLKESLKDLLIEKFINVGPNGTHVAMVQYNDDAKVLFNFKTEAKIENYIRYINKLSPGGMTYMNKALQLARELFTVEAGMRPSVPKVGAAMSFGCATGTVVYGMCSFLKATS